jgi:hypothetical protein
MNLNRKIKEWVHGGMFKWDVVMGLVLAYAIFMLIENGLGFNSDNGSGWSLFGTHSTSPQELNEIRNSEDKENSLRDAGYDGTANMEENARHEYNHGGGYHDMNGNRQIDFQGSREQKEQLDEMDRRGW